VQLIKIAVNESEGYTLIKRGTMMLVDNDKSNIDILEVGVISSSQSRVTKVLFKH
jgi:hypothetical protein